MDPSKRPRADRKLWQDDETQQLMRLATVRRLRGRCSHATLPPAAHAKFAPLQACRSQPDVFMFLHAPCPPALPTSPRLPPVPQDSRYRAHVLHLGEGALDAEMWEAISLYFNCRWGA